jgi:ADP-heptose:LPS heptosyltransferase
MAIHAESAGREKMWPIARWDDFVARFLAAHEDVFVLGLGVEDRGLGTGRARQRFLPCYGLPLPSSLALLACADLFAGIDSCLLHAADLFRVPGVGIFGPTSPVEFGFLFAPHRHVGGDCPITDVAVDDVLRAASALIRDSPGR